ncbi:MAG TPA: type III PLP-dependent enzyme [Tepidisphaeraceae bacterium]|nr:type III PLP-dependent enzyme [Tepidisphaeraceae bacterium]
MTQDKLKKLAKQHGTPLFVVDHNAIRKNYQRFKKYLPRVQAYYAVKANPDPAIVKTLFDLGASFDVASMPEFRIVHENIKNMPAKQRQDWIWDKIIYANPIKANETLQELDPYKPLVTYDNLEEIRKIKKYAPRAGLGLRLKVPNTGSVVELSSKFGAPPGEAVSLIEAAHNAGLVVEGLAFHVGSQCTNFENYVQALNLSASIFAEAKQRGFELKLLDIGGGFPAPYDANVKPFRLLAQRLNSELDRLFPRNIEILAEPGRFMIATAATAVAKIIGKAVRDGKLCYYIDDGVYHTFSGIIFDHCKYPIKAFKKGPTQICSVFGPTCDALDTISLGDELPENLELGDLVYSENIGAYSHASATYFNGFPPATVVHVNQ